MILYAFSIFFQTTYAMCSDKVPNKYYVFNVKYHYVVLYLMLPVDVIIVVNGKIFIFLCVLYAMLNKKDAI